MSRGAPFFYVIVGAPGAGKSSQIIVQLLELPDDRRLIFDIEHEYGKHGTVAGLEAIRQGIIAAGERGPFRFVYQPPDDGGDLRRRFDIFCRLAFAAEHALVVVDELADVDSPNPALVVPGWALMLRRGRKRGLRVIAGTQRPAHVNNNLWSFATRLRAGWLADDGDELLLARALRVPRERVAALKAGEWIERDRLTGATSQGRIAWAAGRPVNYPDQAAPATVKAKKTGERRKRQ